MTSPPPPAAQGRQAAGIDGDADRPRPGTPGYRNFAKWRDEVLRIEQVTAIYGVRKDESAKTSGNTTEQR